MPVWPSTFGLVNERAVTLLGLRKPSTNPRGKVPMCSSISAGLNPWMCAMRSGSTESGTPMWNSMPSGAATSSAKNRPSVRRPGSTRRMSSPSYQPREMAWYPCRVPGAQAGRCAARAAATTSRSARSPTLSGRSIAGSPAWWASSCRTVTASLPAAANSGQYRATGASWSIQPRAWATASASPDTPFVVENTVTSVSSRQGSRRCPSR